MVISKGECIVEDCILSIQSILSRILAFLKISKYACIQIDLGEKKNVSYNP